MDDLVLWIVDLREREDTYAINAKYKHNLYDSKKTVCWVEISSLVLWRAKGESLPRLQLQLQPRTPKLAHHETLNSH